MRRFRGKHRKQQCRSSLFNTRSSVVRFWVDLIDSLNLKKSVNKLYIIKDVLKCGLKVYHNPFDCFLHNHVCVVLYSNTEHNDFYLSFYSVLSRHLYISYECIQKPQTHDAESSPSFPYTL